MSNIEPNKQIDDASKEVFLEHPKGGRFTDWSVVERPAHMPLITIITSTFNAVSQLPWTIDSIRKQVYPYIQWIIADGASKDGTLELIERNKDIIDVWFSAPDSGIYDAWNKALHYAKGDWVQFIGAGDELAAAETLLQISSILATAHPNHDLVYGRLQFISEKNRMHLEEVGQPWSEMVGKWELFRPKLPVHPEVFHHHSIFKDEKTFDTRFKVAGDSHLLMRCIKNKPPLYAPILIDKMPTGGISGSLENTAKIAKEVRIISKELGFKPPITHILYENFKIYGKNLTLALLPIHVVHKIADCYRKIVGKKPRWLV